MSLCLKCPTMNKYLFALILLFGMTIGAKAQEPASFTSGTEASDSEVLQRKAQENTRYFMKRYGVTGADKKTQIYQAYLTYLNTSQEFVDSRLSGNPSATNADAEKALSVLREELQQIAGKQADPSIPR